MKKIGRNPTDANIQNEFDMSEKLRNLEGDNAYKSRAGRKRHSIQYDRRLSLQPLSDRRSSNASSTGESVDSLCKLKVTHCNSMYRKFKQYIVDCKVLKVTLSVKVKFFKVTFMLPTYIVN